MEERAQRIVESAVELAEEGGFEAVRLRDVASHAEVALGTLYRRFRSKEDILVAALELEAERLELRLAKRPPAGGTPVDRAASFFTSATRALCRKPNLARAILRAVVSGEPELTEKVASFHVRMTEMVVGGLCEDPDAATERERAIAFLLQQIWFAALVGWMGGLHGQAAVADQVRAAASLVLGGGREPGEVMPAGDLGK